jgi:hypothetical protein
MGTKFLSHITRAKELLSTARHAAMATVNEDGSPHNTPYRFLYDERLERVYWGSHPESQHSKNILRTGQLFIVVYDAAIGGGLYIRAEQGHVVEDDELDVALAVHNLFRTREGKQPLERLYYEGTAPQRMWCAAITGLWINDAETDAEGLIIRDFRQEITATDLLG